MARAACFWPNPPALLPVRCVRAVVPIQGRAVGGNGHKRSCGLGAGAGVYHTRYGLYHGALGQPRPVSRGDIP